MNHYEALGVEPNATADDIKNAFRKAASRCHPDRGGSAEDMQQRVNAANDCLSDPERRAAYDASGYTEGNGATKKADRAAATLVDAFNAAIARGRDQAVVAGVEDMLRSLIQDGERDKQAMQQQLRRLTRQVARVRVREGENLYEMLVRSRMDELHKNLARVDAATAAFNDALALLKNYEDVADDESKAAVAYSRVLRSGISNNDLLRWL